MFEKEAAEISDAVREGRLNREYAYDWEFDLSHTNAKKTIANALTAAYERGKSDALKVTWQGGAAFVGSASIGLIRHSRNSDLYIGYLADFSKSGAAEQIGTYNNENSARAAVEAAFRGD